MTRLHQSGPRDAGGCSPPPCNNHAVPCPANLISYTASLLLSAETTSPHPVLTGIIKNIFQYRVGCFQLPEKVWSVGLESRVKPFSFHFTHWKGETELRREGAGRLALDQPSQDRVPGARRPTVGQSRQERSLPAPASRRTLTASAAADFRVPHPRASVSSPGPAQTEARTLSIGRSSEGRNGTPMVAPLLVVRAVAQILGAPPPELRQGWSYAKAGAVLASGPFMLPQQPQPAKYLWEIEIVPEPRWVQAPEPSSLGCVWS